MHTLHKPAQPTASRAVVLFAAAIPRNVVQFAKAILLGATLSSGAGAATSISQYGITWTFSQDRPVGQFANGDWYVVGPVTLVDINPKSARPGSQESDTMGNGTMINPIPGQTQGLYRHGPDSEPGNEPKYVDSKNISLQLPYTVAAGNSVYSTVKNPDTWATTPGVTIQEKTWFKETAVLTVLGSVPPAGSFRPAYAGTDKTIRWNKSDMNYAVLRSLAIPVPSNAPSMTWLEEAIKRPLMEMNFNYVNSNWKASWDQSKPGGYTRRTYGREIGHIASGVGLMLNSNLSNAQKEKLLIYMVQWGLDIHGLVNAGMNWQPNGGHNLGRFLPIYIAGKVLNDPAIKANASGAKTFQEMTNHAFVTQSDIDLPRAPHDPPFKPYSQSMLGMPEWSSSGQYNQTSSAWHGNSDGTWWGVPYRVLNGAPNCGTVATILLMGGRSEVNQEAFMRYHIERYYPTERPTGDGGFSGDGNGIQPFVRDMWDVHINGGTITPPPVEPPPPTPVVFAVGDRIHVWRSTWVNSTPSVTTPIGSQATDATGTIVEGPVNTGTDGIIWFRINYDNGSDGWSGADNFVKDSTGQPGAAPSQPEGLKVVK